jgi:hypothetical protein
VTASSRPSTAGAPGAPRARRLQPHHAVYALLIVVIAVCVVILFKKAEHNTTDLDGGNIEQLIPAPGSKILRQETIGIDLAAGFDGTLTVNGTLIPDDQLTKVPSLNQIAFTPGSGKAVQELQAGQNCVIATYWLTATGPSQSSTMPWCFTVV